MELGCAPRRGRTHDRESRLKRGIVELGKIMQKARNVKNIYCAWSLKIGITSRLIKHRKMHDLISRPELTKRSRNQNPLWRRLKPCTNVQVNMRSFACLNRGESK